MSSSSKNLKLAFLFLKLYDVATQAEVGFLLKDINPVRLVAILHIKQKPTLLTRQKKEIRDKYCGTVPLCKI